MRIDTLVATVGALPKPTIEVLLDGIQEICASDICSPIWFAKAVTRVGVDIDLGRLAIKGKIVRVLALFALLTDTRLMIGAQH
jgi:hypothetical protein